MKYMLLIYSEPGVPEFDSDEAQQAHMGEWFEFTQRIVGTGEMVSGEPLQCIETASTVCVRGGQTVVTDGPFAETKEILGGYYLVEVDGLERAQQLRNCRRRSTDATSFGRCGAWPG